MNNTAEQILWYPAEQRVWRRRSSLSRSDWCDQHLRIDRGKIRWRKKKSPYMAQVLDLIGQPFVRKASMAKGIQIGGTIGVYGYVATDLDRGGHGNVLIILADEKMAGKLTRGQMIPMLRKSAELKHLLPENQKEIQVGEIALINGITVYTGWATSLNSISSLPCRVVVKDEFAKWPEDIGHGTSASSEADARADQFPDTCKIIELSSHTVPGSPLDQSLQEADVIYEYWVECPCCKAPQPMVWEQFTWPEDADPKTIQRERLGRYKCCHCEKEWDDEKRDIAVQNGSFVPDREIDRPGHIGIILPGWLSEQNSLSKIIADWLKAQGKPSRLMTWHNRYAAKPFEKQEGKRLAWKVLYDRREKFPISKRDPSRLAVPMSAGVLTAFFDIQDDRIEGLVVAWGVGEESWEIENPIFLGSTLQVQVWKELDEYLKQTFEHESGAELRISAAGIDTGFRSKVCYAFLRNKYHRRIYGTKGGSGGNDPLVSRPRRSNLGKVPFFIIGPNEGKELVMSRLEESPGPGYIHHPTTFDQEYFEQLTAEECIQHWKGGRMKMEWVKKRDRNEALDLRVGNEAVLVLLRPNLKKLVAALQPEEESAEQTLLNQVSNDDQKTAEKKNPPLKKKARVRRPGNGFTSKFRS